MKYEYTGKDMEGSSSCLIEFLSRKAEENHGKSHSEQALFSTRNAAATPLAHFNDFYVLI